jgi:hypothetical protein
MSNDSSNSFIAQFGYHLAAGLVGDCCIANALRDAQQQTSSSQPITLHWRSTFREEDLILAEEISYVYSIDITFQLVTRDKKRFFNTQFGALVSSPLHNKSRIARPALYVQSSSWTQEHLELYAAGTGICVEETGPEGMAKIVATSLADLQDPKVSTFQDSQEDTGCNLGTKLVIDLYHAALFERVRIHLHMLQPIRDGEIGPVAFLLVKNALSNTTTRDDGEKSQEVANVSTFDEWLRGGDATDNIVDVSSCNPEVNECGNDHSTNLEKKASDLSSVLDTNIEDTIISKAVECQHVSSFVDQTSYIKKRDLENETLSSFSVEPEQKVSSSSTKQTSMRSGVVHGAVRKKKRKKGKLTFGKME